MSMRDDLKAYLDGELTEARRAEIEAALASDAGLRREADELKQITSAIQQAAASPDPRGLQDTLHRINRKRSFWSSGWTYALGGAAAFVFLLVVVSPYLMGEAHSLAKSEVASSAGVAWSDETFIRGNAEGADMSVERPANEELKAKGRTRAGADAEMAAPAETEEGYIAFTQLGEPFAPANTTLKESLDTSAIPRDDRQIIRTANIDLEVESVDQRSKEIEQMVTQMRGYIESSETATYNLPRATFHVRVPSERYQEALDKLREMGEVLTESSSGVDVTLEVADLEARKKTMEAEEEQLRTLLGATTKIGEVLEVKDRLNEIRQEIESMDARAKTLRSLASLSTIHVTLQQKESLGDDPKPKGWLEEAWVSAVNGLRAFGRTLAKAGIFLLVYAPIWLIPAILIWIGIRKIRRGK